MNSTRSCCARRTFVILASSDFLISSGRLTKSCGRKPVESIKDSCAEIAHEIGRISDIRTHIREQDNLSLVQESTQLTALLHSLETQPWDLLVLLVDAGSEGGGESPVEKRQLSFQ